MQSNSKTYHTVITSEHKWYDLNLKEVWRYRDLIVLFTQRSFQITYKQTILGPAWIFITPFITSVIYTLVFGKIAGMSTDGIPHILFYLCGNALWNFFATCVTKNASTFTANAGVFGKVYFPRLTTPISNVLSAVIQFLVQMLLVMGFLAYYSWTGDVHPNWLAWLFIPVVLLHLGVMGMGVGIILSSMTTKYRDLGILVGFGMQLLMYATPIIYPLSMIKDNVMHAMLLLNPVTPPMEIFRYAVLGKGTVEPMYVAGSVAFTVFVALLGVMVFNKVEKTFMDTV